MAQQFKDSSNFRHHCINRRNKIVTKLTQTNFGKIHIGCLWIIVAHDMYPSCGLIFCVVWSGYPNLVV